MPDGQLTRGRPVPAVSDCEVATVTLFRTRVSFPPSTRIFQRVLTAVWSGLPSPWFGQNRNLPSGDSWPALPPHLTLHKPNGRLVKRGFCSHEWLAIGKPSRARSSLFATRINDGSDGRSCAEPLSAHRTGFMNIGWICAEGRLTTENQTTPEYSRYAARCP